MVIQERAIADAEHGTRLQHLNPLDPGLESSVRRLIAEELTTGREVQDQSTHHQCGEQRDRRQSSEPALSAEADRCNDGQKAAARSSEEYAVDDGRRRKNDEQDV